MHAYRHFVEMSKNKGWVVNITINQLHMKVLSFLVRNWINEELIHGIGLSYRYANIVLSSYLRDYPHLVVHVIAGIDKFEDVIGLAKRGVKKILVLGEKDFGFNTGKVNMQSPSHVEWRETRG